MKGVAGSGCWTEARQNLKRVSKTGVKRCLKLWGAHQLFHSSLSERSWLFKRTSEERLQEGVS